MQKILSFISSTVAGLYATPFSPTLSPAPKPELGEYCISVFALAKPLGKSPNIIASELAVELAKQSSIFVSTNAVGGYVNFFLTDTLWLEILQTYGDVTHHEKNNKTIVVDYIGANVGKPLHIGHICTPSIGQAICNIYNHLGYEVIGDSHFGDWGGIFGKLIYAWRHIKFGLGEYMGNEYDLDKDFILSNGEMDERERLLEKQGVSFLLLLYTYFHIIRSCNTKGVSVEENREKIEKNREEGAREEFKKLVDGDEENTKLWKRFTAISIAETEKKLDILNVRATYNIGESFYEGLNLPRPNDEKYPDLQYTMKDIVVELIKAGVATQNEDGSVGVIFPEETKIPSCILQKKDGTGLYLTSDLAAIKYRLTNGWNPSKLIYSVDVRQQLHLKQAFTIAQMAWPELTRNIEFFHAFNGFIKLKEGAMSTRHGTVIFLEKLIEEGSERTKKILEEKGRNLSHDDIQAITIAAIKYSYLSQDREKDVTFDWDKALAFEGNSGPYIQYAYVRAAKITSHADIGEYRGADMKLSEYDKTLISTLARADEIIEQVEKTYKPHHLALYAYDLAVTFNSFYVHTPKILDETNISLRNLRLDLVKKTATKLKLAFELLGIKMPTEM